MSQLVEKHITVPAETLVTVESLLDEGEHFEDIVPRALRLWIRRRRRKAYGDMIRRAAAQRTAEQRAEDQAIVEQACRSGPEVLESEVKTRG